MRILIAAESHRIDFSSKVFSLEQAYLVKIGFTIVTYIILYGVVVAILLGFINENQQRVTGPTGIVMENKVVVSITRRDLVVFTAGVLATSTIYKYRIDKPRLINLPELYDLVRELNPPYIVKSHLTARQAFGTDYLNDLYEGIQKGLQRTIVLRIIVDVLIDQDHKNGRVLYVEGWAMTNTEVALCLLS